MNAKTRLCGIIGNPIKHSLSPIMHNAAFRELGLNYVYLAFDVTDVKNSLAGIKALDIRGVSVTIPHKIAVMEYLNEVDPIARKIGAVNTIVNDNGRLKGYNTDWEGLTRSLELHTTIKNKQVVILGAGGSARAVAFGIKQRGGKITILNRTEAKAQALAEDVDCEYGMLSQSDIVAGADIIINTTPLGMHPHTDSMAVEGGCLQAGQIINDIVYNPLQTRLLREAKEQGCVTIYGSEMLVLQGAVQFELWTGQPAPVDIMREAMLQYLKLGDKIG